MIKSWNHIKKIKKPKYNEPNIENQNIKINKLKRIKN
jgi:hypothetical protein